LFEQQDRKRTPWAIRGVIIYEVKRMPACCIVDKNKESSEAVKVMCTENL
jgi:hypothetical protein